MGARRLIVLAVLVLFAGLVAVPAALAVTTTPPPVLHATVTVRVEGTSRTVAPRTAVDVPWNATIVDTDGTTIVSTQCNALAALALAANLRGFTYDYNTSYGAPFLTTIGGLTFDPVDYSNGWTYMINGVGYPVLDMGVYDAPIKPGDAIVYAQNPDPTFKRGVKLLKVRVTPGVAALPGKPVTITVVGDNVAKANSSAEATRWGASKIETPAQFAAAAGATIHVGSRVYVDGAGSDAANGAITVSDLPKGTYSVWAEMPMGANFSYVRSAPVRINVDAAPRFVAAAITARAVAGGARLLAHFRISKAATVTLIVLDRAGRRLDAVSCKVTALTAYALTSRRLPSGKFVRAKLVARDAWGRTTATSLVGVRLP